MSVSIQYNLDGVSGVSETGGFAMLSPQQVVERLRDNVRQVYRDNVADTRLADAYSLVAARKLEQVLAEVLKTEYAERTSEKDMTIGPFGVSPWAKTWVQKITNRAGQLDYVTSDDFPEVNVSAREVARSLYTIGGQISYSYFELEQARFAGVPLDTAELEALSEAAEDTQNEILLRGDGKLKHKGLHPTGFYNDKTVPVAGASKSFEELYAQRPGKIIDEVLSWNKKQVKATADRGQYAADTLLLPSDQFQVLLRPRGEGTDTSLRNWLLSNTPLKTIASRPMLEGMGDSDSDRAIIYKNTPRVVRGVVPLPFQLLPPETRSLQTQVKMFSRIGGCDIRMPAAILYVDGV